MFYCRNFPPICYIIMSHLKLNAFFTFLSIYCYIFLLSECLMFDGKVPPRIAEIRSNQTLMIGSKFKFLCYLESGTKPFKFEWFKNNQAILENKSPPSSSYTIKTNEDESMMSITAIDIDDEGIYSCSVRNDFGTDRKSIRLVVKVPPSWLVEPKDVHTNGKERYRLECKADGSPKPTIKWITSKGITIESEYLDVDKYRTANIDSYECVADNGVGEPLRKAVKVSFMVPVKFNEKFFSLKTKRGESARLECNATGDQPLSIQWTKNNVKLEKLGSNYEIIDTEIHTGIRSELFIQTTQSNDAAVYKCFAENEHGKDERTIRLEVVEVPGVAKNVHVKEVWSRTVSLAWSEPYSGNLPIQRYVIQFWRYQSGPHRLNEVLVSGSQTSYFLKDLTPGQSYELSIIAENEIGKGSSSTPISFVTGEEEPSAPPNDITVESMGPTTLRITWRSPPIENWNGDLKGYYIGYRRAQDNNSPFIYITMPIVKDFRHHTQSSPNSLSSSSSSSSASTKIRSSSSSSSAVKKEIHFHEYFLRQLNKGVEYKIVVKAYNSAGSGPQSHEIMATTFDGDLPPAFQLNVIDSTEETISLQWYQKLHGSSSALSSPSSIITSYTIHYRKEGEIKWKEVPISATLNVMGPTNDPNGHHQQSSLVNSNINNNNHHYHQLNSYSFVLENLDANVNYMIYVAAINRFGIGDPSNIATVHTQNGMSMISHEVVRRFNDANYYLEPMFVWPLLIAIVIIVLVLLVAYVFIRKTQNSNDNPCEFDFNS
ncbi:Down syndrome cell adhesion molecule -like protein [Sarcoptes scabiei]|uniref:Down syndrome cell adhesion molecule -like protein n=1 Tax=Sarcoptes scabiei TaxID=52283 RepID=A0A834VH98_SARSC|nr:Down syndrome cell adhesion molecule -like protein [Sarcoptes scabiei]